MPLTPQQAKSFVEQVLAEITANQAELDERFPNLRAVDAKVREVKLALEEVGASQLVTGIGADEGFTANSRRVRLEQLAHHCRTAMKWFAGGGIKARKTITRAPDVSRLTQVLPELDQVIQSRWLEAQKCQHAQAHTAAVIMMGSIMEALLLARCQLRPADAYQSKHAPKDKHGNRPPIQDWNLHTLIEVSADLGWIKTDRGKFSHGLRESRNIVHPWQHAVSRANFDEATCNMCWQVLNASVADWLASL